MLSLVGFLSCKNSSYCGYGSRLLYEIHIFLPVYPFFQPSFFGALDKSAAFLCTQIHKFYSV